MLKTQNTKPKSSGSDVCVITAWRETVVHKTTMNSCDNIPCPDNIHCC